MFLLPGSGQQLQSLDGGCPRSPDLKTIIGGHLCHPCPPTPGPPPTKTPLGTIKPHRPPAQPFFHPTPTGWGHTGDTVQQKVALLKRS